MLRDQRVPHVLDAIYYLSMSSSTFLLDNPAPPFLAIIGAAGNKALVAPYRFLTLGRGLHSSGWTGWSMTLLGYWGLLC